jgi:hypothetical protein
MCVVLSQTKNGLRALGGGFDELVVGGLHPFLGQRPSVLDLLLADFAPARHHGRVVLVRGPGVDHAPWAEVLSERREILFRRVVIHLRLFLRVEVVEVAEKFVETVVRRQHVVEIAEVVLAELTGGVPLFLDQRGDRHELVRHADRGGRDANLGEAGAVDALAGDEGRAARGAGLFAVTVGEQHAFLGNAVDVGRTVAHEPVGITAQVRLADIIAPDHEDVGLARLLGAVGSGCLGHGIISSWSEDDEVGSFSMPRLYCSNG